MSTIAQIHADIYSQEEKLLKYVNDHLSKVTDEAKDRLNRLVELGFTSIKEKTTLHPRTIEDSINLRDFIEHYRIHYPNNKFITEDKVIEICKRWNLVHAPVNLFIGSIPEKNQKEILSLQVKVEDERNTTARLVLENDPTIKFNGYTKRLSQWDERILFGIIDKPNSFLSNVERVEIESILRDTWRTVYNKGIVYRSDLQNVSFDNYVRIGQRRFGIPVRDGDYENNILLKEGIANVILSELRLLEDKYTIISSPSLLNMEDKMINENCKVIYAYEKTSRCTYSSLTMKRLYREVIEA